MPRNINRISDLERKYVLDVLDRQFSSSSGAVYMERLEREFARVCGTKFAVSMVNGTATLHAALEAAGIGVGDEVIVPPLTMSATTFAVLQTGATPVFADIDPETFLITASSIEARISSATKAIITVALYGLSPDMDPIMRVAENHRLFVLEDNAECFLGRYRDRVAGTLGHAGSFSFQSSKHLTSGEGGILVTDDEELALEMRRVGSLGYAGVGAGKAKISKADIQDPTYSRHVSMGWNYRMPELCCAVALAQVERIGELVERRQAVAQLFTDVLSGCDWISVQKTPGDCVNSYWAFTVALDPDGPTWHEFTDRFRSHGGDGIYGAWQLTYLEPMFLQRRFRNREAGINSERMSEYGRGLCPVAEDLQPRLMQFKTNYWGWSDAETQAAVLAETLRDLSR